MEDIERLEKIIQNQVALQLTETELPGLYDPMRYMLNGGGKRMRPQLMFLAYRLFAKGVDQVVPAALALELYHNHTLLHDDVMDNSDLRHGMPTVHKKWNENTAILSGDVMLILSIRHLLRLKCTHKNEILDIALSTMQQICEGQQLDMEFESKQIGEVAEHEYLKMITLKTSVLLACSLQIGALIGGASLSDSEKLYLYGLKLGLAFQIQDDYLDCFADPTVFGKNVGGDIREKKHTYILIKALEIANDSDKQLLISCFEDSKVNVEKVIDIYKKINVANVATAQIQKLFDDANNILDTISCEPNEKENLKKYAVKLLKRNK